MNNELTQYNDIVEFLYFISSGICKQYDFQITIESSNKGGFNAGVSKLKEKQYIVIIYSDCFNLNNIIEKITCRYTKDDLNFFWRLKNLNIFENQEEDNYRDELNNLISTIILLHVFFHECGYIIAGHVEGLVQEYIEYDSLKSGNFIIQEHEIVADWLSTKYLYQLMYYTVVKGEKLKLDELLSVFTQITVLCWLSLTIEFQIFDSIHNVSVKDCINSTHPHPAVRLYSNLDAMRESMADILLVQYDVTAEEAEDYMNQIINEFYIIITSFLQITDTPIDVEKNKAEVIDYYIRLRETPYNNGKMNDKYFHLAELSKEYKDACEKYKKYL